MNFDLATNTTIRAVLTGLNTTPNVVTAYLTSLGPGPNYCLSAMSDGDTEVGFYIDGDAIPLDEYDPDDPDDTELEFFYNVEFEAEEGDASSFMETLESRVADIQDIAGGDFVAARVNIRTNYEGYTLSVCNLSKNSLEKILISRHFKQWLEQKRTDRRELENRKEELTAIAREIEEINALLES